MASSKRSSSSWRIFGEQVVPSAAAKEAAVPVEAKSLKPTESLKPIEPLKIADDKLSAATTVDIFTVIADIKKGKQAIFIPPHDATSDETARIRESLRSSEVQKDFFDALKNSNVQELHFSKIPKEFSKPLIEFFKNIKKDKIKNQITHLSIVQSDSALPEHLLDLMQAAEDVIEFDFSGNDSITFEQVLPEEAEAWEKIMRRGISLKLDKDPTKKNFVPLITNNTPDATKNWFLDFCATHAIHSRGRGVLSLKHCFDRFEGKAMLLRKSMLSLARLDLTRTGYDLSLMCVDDEKQIDEFVLDRAKKKHMPILIWIKNKNEYRVFGDQKGDGNWCFTKVRTAIPQDLPFEEKILSRSDKKFTESLSNILKECHTPKPTLVFSDHIDVHLLLNSYLQHRGSPLRVITDRYREGSFNARLVTLLSENGWKLAGEPNSTMLQTVAGKFASLLVDIDERLQSWNEKISNFIKVDKSGRLQREYEQRSITPLTSLPMSSLITLQWLLDEFTLRDRPEEENIRSTLRDYMTELNSVIKIIRWFEAVLCTTPENVLEKSISGDSTWYTGQSAPALPKLVTLESKSAEHKSVEQKASTTVLTVEDLQDQITLLRHRELLRTINQNELTALQSQLDKPTADIPIKQIRQFIKEKKKMADDCKKYLERLDRATRWDAIRTALKEIKNSIRGHKLLERDCGPRIRICINSIEDHMAKKSTSFTGFRFKNMVLDTTEAEKKAFSEAQLIVVKKRTATLTGEVKQFPRGSSVAVLFSGPRLVPGQSVIPTQLADSIIFPAIGGVVKSKDDSDAARPQQASVSFPSVFGR